MHYSQQFSSGRMPEKQDEILLPENFLANAKEKYQVGDTITLETGQRFIEKEQLSENTPYQENESLKNTTKHYFYDCWYYGTSTFEIEEFSLSWLYMHYKWFSYR